MILCGKSFSGIILVILDDSLGQKSISRSNMILPYMLHIGARIIHCYGVILTG